MQHLHLDDFPKAYDNTVPQVPKVQTALLLARR